jgi:hypothetical protein
VLEECDSKLPLLASAHIPAPRLGSPLRPPLDLVGQHPTFAILTIVSWQWTPFMMLILLARLQSLLQLT